MSSVAIKDFSLSLTRFLSAISDLVFSLIAFTSVPTNSIPASYVSTIKYSKEGSTVTVQVTVHDVFVRITVRDMGCGIKKEDLPRIKEKFYKANQTVRGSGIGLAVADEIVRQHNGFIEIDSVEGYGTTVMIELPFIVSNEGE